MSFIKNKKLNTFKRITTIIILAAFLSTSIIPPQAVQAQSLPNLLAGLGLPVPGTMVQPSAGYVPPLLKGLVINPKEPFNFEFIIDQGHTRLTPQELNDESVRLIKYFLTSLTLPEDELWVNLSPAEENRIIPEEFGKTEMGRDLLAQDYLLKQLTASLVYPEGELGENFWKEIRKKLSDEHGIEEIPAEIFHKVWIVPDEAVVYENGDRIYIVHSHLRVLMEEDYPALRSSQPSAISHPPSELKAESRKLTAEILKQVILPAIEHEVNEGAHFAQLRQIYHSFILAAWYKETLETSVINKQYSDQKKVAGLESPDPEAARKIYGQYMEALKKGVYDYIKEDYDPQTQEVIPRHYFSGGAKLHSHRRIDNDAAVTSVGPVSRIVGAFKNIDAAFLSPSDRDIVDELAERYDLGEAKEAVELFLSEKIFKTSEAAFAFSSEFENEGIGVALSHDILREAKLRSIAAHVSKDDQFSAEQEGILLELVFGQISIEDAQSRLRASGLFDSAIFPATKSARGKAASFIIRDKYGLPRFHDKPVEEYLLSPRSKRIFDESVSFFRDLNPEVRNDNGDLLEAEDILREAEKLSENLQMFKLPDSFRRQLKGLNAKWVPEGWRIFRQEYTDIYEDEDPDRPSVVFNISGRRLSESQVLIYLENVPESIVIYQNINDSSVYVLAPIAPMPEDQNDTGEDIESYRKQLLLDDFRSPEETLWKSIHIVKSTNYPIQDRKRNLLSVEEAVRALKKGFGKERGDRLFYNGDHQFYLVAPPKDAAGLAGLEREMEAALPGHIAFHQLKAYLQERITELQRFSGYEGLKQHFGPSFRPLFFVFYNDVVVGSMLIGPTMFWYESDIGLVDAVMRKITDSLGAKAEDEFFKVVDYGTSVRVYGPEAEGKPLDERPADAASGAELAINRRDYINGLGPIGELTNKKGEPISEHEAEKYELVAEIEREHPNVVSVSLRRLSDGRLSDTVMTTEFHDNRSSGDIFLNKVAFESDDKDHDLTGLGLGTQIQILIEKSIPVGFKKTSFVTNDFRKRELAARFEIRGSDVAEANSGRVLVDIPENLVDSKTEVALEAVIQDSRAGRMSGKRFEYGEFEFTYDEVKSISGFKEWLRDAQVAIQRDFGNLPDFMYSVVKIADEEQADAAEISPPSVPVWEMLWGYEYPDVDGVRKWIDRVEDDIGSVVVEVGPSEFPGTINLEGRKIIMLDIGAPEPVSSYEEGLSPAILLKGNILHPERTPRYDEVATFLGISKPAANLDEQLRGKVDSIILPRILNWVDYKKAIKTVRMWLKPGGTLLIYNRPGEGGGIQKGVINNHVLFDFLEGNGFVLETDIRERVGPDDQLKLTARLSDAGIQDWLSGPFEDEQIRYYLDIRDKYAEIFLEIILAAREGEVDLKQSDVDADFEDNDFGINDATVFEGGFFHGHWNMFPARLKEKFPEIFNEDNEISLSSLMEEDLSLSTILIGDYRSSLLMIDLDDPLDQLMDERKIEPAERELLRAWFARGVNRQLGMIGENARSEFDAFRKKRNYDWAVYVAPIPGGKKLYVTQNLRLNSFVDNQDVAEYQEHLFYRWVAVHKVKDWQVSADYQVIGIQDKNMDQTATDPADAAEGIKPRILFVEDSPLTRLQIGFELHRNYDLVEASDGQAALRMLKEQEGRFDGAIVDAALPIMDGISLVRIMAADFPNIPVLFWDHGILTQKSEALKKEFPNIKKVMAKDPNKPESIVDPMRELVLVNSNSARLKENAEIKSSTGGRDDDAAAEAGSIRVLFDDHVLRAMHQEELRREIEGSDIVIVEDINEDEVALLDELRRVASPRYPYWSRDADVSFSAKPKATRALYDAIENTGVRVEGTRSISSFYRSRLNSILSDMSQEIEDHLINGKIQEMLEIYRDMIRGISGVMLDRDQLLVEQVRDLRKDNPEVNILIVRGFGHVGLFNLLRKEWSGDVSRVNLGGNYSRKYPLLSFLKLKHYFNESGLVEKRDLSLDDLFMAAYVSAQWYVFYTPEEEERLNVERFNRLFKRVNAIEQLKRLGVVLSKHFNTLSDKSKYEKRRDVYFEWLTTPDEDGKIIATKQELASLLDAAAGSQNNMTEEELPSRFLYSRDNPYFLYANIMRGYRDADDGFRFIDGRSDDSMRHGRIYQAIQEISKVKKARVLVIGPGGGRMIYEMHQEHKNIDLVYLNKEQYNIPADVMAYWLYGDPLPSAEQLEESRSFLKYYRSNGLLIDVDRGLRKELLDKGQAEPYDVIIVARQVLRYVRKKYELLADVKELLNNGGIAFVTDALEVIDHLRDENHNAIASRPGQIQKILNEVGGGNRYEYTRDLIITNHNPEAPFPPLTEYSSKRKYGTDTSYARVGSKKIRIPITYDNRYILKGFVIPEADPAADGSAGSEGDAAGLGNLNFDNLQINAEKTEARDSLVSQLHQRPLLWPYGDLFRKGEPQGYFGHRYLVYENSLQGADVKVPKFLNEAFRRAMNDPDYRENTRLVFLSAGADPLYEMAQVMARVTGDFPEEHVHKIWATMNMLQTMRDHPEQKNIFFKYLQQEGIVSAQTKNIIFVDTDTRIGPVGTEALIYSVFYDENNQKAWNIEDEGRDIQILYMKVGDDPFLDRMNRDIVRLYYGIDLPGFSRFARRVHGFQQIDPEVARYWEGIDGMLKIASVEPSLMLDQGGRVSLVELPPYGFDHIPPSELRVAYYLQHAGLTMATLDVLEGFGYDVGEEQKMILADLENDLLKSARNPEELAKEKAAVTAAGYLRSDDGTILFEEEDFAAAGGEADAHPKSGILGEASLAEGQEPKADAALLSPDKSTAPSFSGEIVGNEWKADAAGTEVESLEEFSEDLKVVDLDRMLVAQIIERDYPRIKRNPEKFLVIRHNRRNLYSIRIGEFDTELGQYSNAAIFINLGTNVTIKQLKEYLDREYSDAAQAPGGIDFNRAHLNLKREGSNIQPPAFDTLPDLEQIEIRGLVPVIFSITPVFNLPLLLGMKPKAGPQQLSRLPENKAVLPTNDYSLITSQ